MYQNILMIYGLGLLSLKLLNIACKHKIADNNIINLIVK